MDSRQRLKRYLYSSRNYVQHGANIAYNQVTSQRILALLLAFVSSQHLCSNPGSVHIIVAWLTLKSLERGAHPMEHAYRDPDTLPSEASPAITRETLVEIEDPAKQLREDKPKLYIVFVGNAMLNLPEQMREIPIFYGKMSTWQCVVVRQAGYKYVLGRSETDNWLAETIIDVKSIVRRIAAVQTITDIVCLGYSLGGLAASIFARECALRLSQIKFTYVGYRIFNSEPDAAESIPLNFRFGQTLSTVLRKVCHSARTNDDNYFKSVKANLEAAYTIAKSGNSTPLKVGVINGKPTNDFLAGSTRALEEWLRQTPIVCLIDEIEGGHMHIRSDLISTVVQNLNNTRENDTESCIILHD